VKKRKLKILPGKRWQGTMAIGPEVCGGYVVDFDATIVGATHGEQWVGDRAVLTAQQIEDWTGVRLP